MREDRLPKLSCSVVMFCVAVMIASPAQTFKTLVNFDGTDGSDTELMSLVQGTDGNFYGTNCYGGANGAGTVFKVTAHGKLTTLHSFDNTNGACPWAGLVQAHNGVFYGTTAYGGASGAGTVFKITQSGEFTLLHNFCGFSACRDGATPASPLVEATNGDFYGTTSSYATNVLGTIFKITPGGELTTLHSFCSRPHCTDGSVPIGGLVQARDGDFYGTTAFGGSNPLGGTIFRMTPDGMLATLYSFASSDGSEPFSALVQATDGDFYGTTLFGGPMNRGTVFKITPGGKLTTLYDFCSLPNCIDGYWPDAGLVEATDGSFYGTTYGGGSSPDCGPDCGTLFKISRNGKLTTLHSFDNTDGRHPVGALLQATNGDFYGTTPAGGANDDAGTVFSLSMGLGPFVKTQPNFGEVGANVIILGNKLSHTTSVTFNGTAAKFNIVSSTEIKTSVPTGATTGSVEVTTSGGVLKSNVPFRVKK